ncbi:MAG: hypothetical protein HYU86_02375 [Chloroflexi bacterium]|nr:hypothetical protein [Chloroflexota bacterium]
MAIPTVVSQELWNTYTYATWSAINRLLPRETVQKIRDLTGEIAYDELEARHNLADIKDPMTLLERLGELLTQMGLATFHFEHVGPNEFYRYMQDLSIPDCPGKLKDEGGLLPGPSHAIMAASIKKRFPNLRLESQHTDEPPHPLYGPRSHEKIVSK